MTIKKMISTDYDNKNALYFNQEKKRIIRLEKRMRMRNIIEEIKKNNLTQQNNIINMPNLNLFR